MPSPSNSASEGRFMPATIFPSAFQAPASGPANYHGGLPLPNHAFNRFLDTLEGTSGSPTAAMELTASPEPL